MMIHAYSELYLNDAKQNLTDFFDYAINVCQFEAFIEDMNKKYYAVTQETRLKTIREKPWDFTDRACKAFRCETSVNTNV